VKCSAITCGLLLWKLIVLCCVCRWKLQDWWLCHHYKHHETTGGTSQDHKRHGRQDQTFCFVLIL